MFRFHDTFFSFKNLDITRCLCFCSPSFLPIPPCKRCHAFTLVHFGRNHIKFVQRRIVVSVLLFCCFVCLIICHLESDELFVVGQRENANATQCLDNATLFDAEREDLFRDLLVKFDSQAELLFFSFYISSHFL